MPSYVRMTMVINGAQRSFVCDKNDSLATVLRRMGLTGTKVGCRVGQCGACEVIVDGKVVRSCTRKMSKIPEYSEIITIEGIGTAMNLHPLQKAWMTYGGIQCGFCTPGFIMSAYGLLLENKDPTREEVRAWFMKNRNACRCTGYKPLVDAVMAAAKVMRGEWTMDDLEYKLPENGHIYNTRYPRPSALPRVLGLADYGNDVILHSPDMLHAALVMARVHHANILSIDTSEAEKAPGVVKVVTAKDIQGINRITLPVSFGRVYINGFERPIINDKKIFSYGDVPAYVIADTEEHARAAAKLVKVEYEELPYYLNAIETLGDDFIGIHEGYPAITNEGTVFFGEEDPREIIANSKYVVSGSYYTQREPHFPIEPDVGSAFIDDEGIINLCYKIQYMDWVAPLISKGLGVTPDKIRIFQNPAGGSFGYSMDLWNQAVLCALTMAVDGRHVGLSMNYEEQMLVCGKRLPYYTNATIGMDENGKITATTWETLADKGAYSYLTDTYLNKGMRFYGLPYKFPAAWGWCGIAMANNSLGVPYRGAGSPQLQTASESLMEMLSAKTGIDPWEIRFRNILRPGDKHYNDHEFTVYPMEELMLKAKPKYEECLKRKAEIQPTLPENIKRGVGICCGCYNVTSSAHDKATVSMELGKDDHVYVYSNWPEVGQGGEIGSIMNAHEALAQAGLLLPLDKMHLRHGDTKFPSNHGPAAGSRSHYIDGKAMWDAATKLVGAMKKEDGSLRTYEEMAAEGIPTIYLGIGDTTPLTDLLDPNTGKGNTTPEYQYAVYVSEVDVDVTTGKTKVVSMHVFADVGVVGNWLSVEGQAYGGMEHSIGYGLSEDFSDHKKHTSLIGAGFPYIDMIPDGDNFTVNLTETPRPTNPFGSGGCSEVFQSSDHMAVFNAIHDATGAWLFKLPARPDDILAAIKLAEEGKEPEYEPYWFGKDFDERMEYLKANPMIKE